jgi:hypothetical protein
MPIFDFGDWLASKSWNMYRDGDRDAMRLAYAISLAFAEYDHGDFDEDGLGQQLSSLLNNIDHSISRPLAEAIQPRVAWQFSGSNVWVPPLEVPLLPVSHASV